MSAQPPHRSWSVALLLVLGLGAALGGALYARSRLHPVAPPPPATRVAAVYPEPRPLPEFSLIADDGRAAGRSVFAGRWSLVFFGYTHCPDACPTTLAMLHVLDGRLADLPPERRPVVWFVSVDPARDSVSLVHDYVRFFGEGFRGLTGSEEAIGKLTRELGVAVIVRHGAGGEYTVDHTAAILLVDPTSSIRALFPAPHAVDAIDADYRTIVGWAGSPPAASR